MATISDLIRKKGPLSCVWIAGTATDKLGKKMILAADISNLAQRIMEEDRVNLVLRLSGMLLKGLVIVYTKKMQYVLTDCEDVISRIKLSFQPNIIDLEGKNTDEIVPIINDISSLIEEPALSLQKWAELRPTEQGFVVSKHIDFKTAEITPVTTDLSSDSQMSTTSQTFDDDLGHPTLGMLSPELSRWTKPVLRANWDTDEDLSNNDSGVSDTIPIPAHYTTDSESGNEGDQTEEGQQKRLQKKRMIVDERIKNSSQQIHPERPRRQAAEVEEIQITNIELDDLFERSRELGQQKIKEMEEDLNVETNRTAYEHSESDTSAAPMFQGVDTSSDYDVEVNRAAQQKVLGLDSGSSTNVSSLVSPTKRVELESPYPNLKFVVEQTPKRTVENSISPDTIKALNKIKGAIGDKSSLPFDTIFAGSSRRSAASAFYQLLVLKSTNCVDVKQSEPYGRIDVSVLN